MGGGGWILRRAHYSKATLVSEPCTRKKLPGGSTCNLVQDTRYVSQRQRSDTGEGSPPSGGKRGGGRLKEQRALGRTW